MPRIFFDKDHNLNVQDLEIKLYEQDNQIMAYSKDLDLVTCGKDFNNAVEMFSDACKLFLEYLIDENTLGDVLQELGWKEENHEQEFIPPKELGTRKLEILIPSHA